MTVAAIHRGFEVLPLVGLIPYARNARTHDDAQVAQIAASIREFGFANPVLIDEDGGIIAGHGRVLAARQLAMSDVPCIRLVGLSPTQRRAYVLADNKIALNAGWDVEVLANELAELEADGFDLALLGFSEAEISLLSQSPSIEDDVPAPPAEPVTVRGDVWVLGKHRIVCGDCTSADEVGRLLGAVRPALMVTDPPYGVEYDADWRNRALRSIGGRAVGKVDNDDRADWTDAWTLFPGDVIYCWHSGTMAHVVAGSLLSAGFEIRSQIIWAKNQFVIGRGHYHPQHEPCWYAVRKGATGHWNGDRTQATLWEIDKPRKSETGHSAQKPVECMLRPIQNNSNVGQAVYDPFVGSGTTLIAAEQSGRICCAMELNPAYVDVSVMRWQNFTGLRAKRESDGEAFPES